MVLAQIHIRTGKWEVRYASSESTGNRPWLRRQARRADEGDRLPQGPWPDPLRQHDEGESQAPEPARSASELARLEAPASVG